MKILCTGDLHLGRFPTHVPKSSLHSVSSVWRTVQQYAIDRKVDAVMLTGDLVEHSNSFFEAYAPLRNGIINLVEQGVDVVAISGNHDYEVFPRLVRDIGHERFHFLGREGKWESVGLRSSGEHAVTVHGWSFTERYCDDNPLKGHTFQSAERPTLGLLHCDVDVPNSRYAPVRQSDFEGIGVDGWLLGHIHSPGLQRTPSGIPVLYPGSPQPLDPGETGPHGPWVLELGRNGVTAAEQVPLATVRYENTPVDISGQELLSDVQDLIAASCQAQLRDGLEDSDHLRHLTLTLRLIGSTTMRDELEGIDPEKISAASVTETARCSVRRIDVVTSPAYDLELLSHERDPRGVLARLVRQLDQGEMPEELGVQTYEAIEGVYGANAYSMISEGSRPDQPKSAALLRSQAMLLLDKLTRQKEEKR